mgnify:CR=1 FL=1
MSSFIILYYSVIFLVNSNNVYKPEEVLEPISGEVIENGEIEEISGEEISGEEISEEISGELSGEVSEEVVSGEVSGEVEEVSGEESEEEAIPVEIPDSNVEETSIEAEPATEVLDAEPVVVNE